LTVSERAKAAAAGKAFRLLADINLTQLATTQQFRLVLLSRPRLSQSALESTSINKRRRQADIAPELIPPASPPFG
jgi:hypothetical protein